jgi:hypothetical protein
VYWIRARSNWLSFAELLTSSKSIRRGNERHFGGRTDHVSSPTLSENRHLPTLDCGALTKLSIPLADQQLTRRWEPTLHAHGSVLLVYKIRNLGATGLVAHISESATALRDICDKNTDWS